MCESTVYLMEKKAKSEFMTDVARIEITSDGIVCYSIIGEKREVRGAKVKTINLMDHSIILEK